MSKQAPLRAVALMGATGTGKSALALALAEPRDICLISCDSMQVYQGLDIGTSKPLPSEQAKVRHALIDCTDVSAIWNAQIWADAALKIIAQENLNGKVPIIVGGTGMYLKALLQGFAEVPAEKEGVRAHFEQIQQEQGTAYLYQQLQVVDAALASRLEPQDSQRIIRGLSVFESTGIPLSVWHDKQAKSEQQAKDNIHCPVFVLERPREELRARIAKRFMQMMDVGWLEETKWLQSLGLPDTHPVMRAVGYRQLLDHLQGDDSLDAAIEKGITATRRYAKRQGTWFRNQTKTAFRGQTSEVEQAMKSALGRY
ncbi:tRNA (adenosine(37)-N6)-dimethylallyltransferase MiaA [Ghiorsea bivora]|uniref:tRNA (adenosine(37)-N6)-dimethylallyltransferase MiaA n=1 Tax=Ghiorsea bivora TaxID=1485545 RepID=UPI00056E86EE|nr:tRNA (adenosine(37)-N6)-dimethylallyltransferase MiaA [Ghiorsea bivora]